MLSERAMRAAKALFDSFHISHRGIPIDDSAGSVRFASIETLADLIYRAADIPALEARVAELERELRRVETSHDEVNKMHDALAKRLEIIEALAVNLLRLARGES